MLSVWVIVEDIEIRAEASSQPERTRTEPSKWLTESFYYKGNAKRLEEPACVETDAFVRQAFDFERQKENHKTIAGQRQPTLPRPSRDLYAARNVR
jgi:hypothetical protein